MPGVTSGVIDKIPDNWDLAAFSAEEPFRYSALFSGFSLGLELSHEYTYNTHLTVPTYLQTDLSLIHISEPTRPY